MRGRGIAGLKLPDNVIHGGLNRTGCTGTEERWTGYSGTGWTDV